MFHQANVVPTDITLDDGTVIADITTLEYWYQVVLEKMALYLNLQGTDPFPAKVGNTPVVCLMKRDESPIDHGTQKVDFCGSFVCRIRIGPFIRDQK